MSNFIKVATTDEIPPGQGKVVEVQGRQLALFNLGGSFYAVDNTCTHAGGPLGEGVVTGDKVECPWHGASFDVKTGAVLNPPASANVVSYKVRVSGSNVEVEL